MNTEQRDLFGELQEEIKKRQAPAPKVESKPIVLRPYQIDSVEAVFREFETVGTTLVCLPTGCGKSVVFSNIMRRFNDENPLGRVLVLAHRTELISQAKDHARNAGLTAGIEMGHERAGREAVVVSTIQTQNAPSRCLDCHGDGCDFCDGIGKRRRMTKFNPNNFSLLVIDEAHHATAVSYRNVLAYYRQNPNLKVLLVTATPERSDGTGLHNVCDSVAFEMQLKAAIDDGWLVPIRQKFVTVDSLDFSKVPRQAGDIQAKGLERSFLGDCDEEEERLLHAVAKPTLEQAEGKPVLVFSSGQEHAEKLTAAFNAYDGVQAEMVIDKTDKVERREIIKRYKAGTTQVLVNCMVFTEGFDAPATAVIANTRPTGSESLLLQMIGRATRPLPGVVDGPETAQDRRNAIAQSDKTHCTILDFVGNSGRHKVTTVFDLLAGEDVEPIDLEEALRVAESEQVEVDIEEALERAKAAREAKEKKLEEERLKRASTRHRADAAVYTATDVDLFKGVDFDPKQHYTPGPNSPSQGQVKYLMTLGLTPEAANAVTKRQASGIIKDRKNRKGGEAIITFGKHKGNAIKNVPSGYLNWIMQTSGFADIKPHIEQYRSTK